MTSKTTYTEAEWKAEAVRRFGSDPLGWKFICPVCEHEQSVRDYKAVGAPQESVAFSCMGRWIQGSKQAFDRTKTGPCTYTGGGLIKLNPVEVVRPDGDKCEVFDFAPSPVAAVKT